MENIDFEIKGIIESSFLDWDGKIVTTVYLPGCNFSCPFCHNWELIEHPENFKTVPIIELERHLQSNRDFLDGVCITGGEPTLYSSLPLLIGKIKDLGLKVKLDTNGTKPKFLAQLIDDDLLDYIAMDIKAPLNERYHVLSGKKVDLANIKKSIEIIMKSNIEYEFRTTMVPSLLEPDDLLEISKSLSGAKKYVLQQFVKKNARDEKLQNVTLFDRESILTIKEQINDHVRDVTVKGIKQP
jgi:pyruvate formate lyase activating enzyme